MKAVVCQGAKLEVADLPEPVPGPGQVLLEVLRCGICGSDLHARHHCDHWADVMGRSGYPRFARSGEAIVFGHEFCGEVLEYGPGCRKRLKPGTHVCALPLRRNGEQVDMIGLSSAAPGAYAERLVVQESAMVEVPNGLDADRAALTEPMAVAWHAVARGEVRRDGMAIVIGCGPVGLAVIAILKSHGVDTVVAADFSPGRRALAKWMGADIVVDPEVESPYENCRQRDFVEGVEDLMGLALGTRERLERLPVPWWHSWRLAEALGAKPKAPVIFECVGGRRVLQSIIEGAPTFSRVVVVGVCMSPDTIEPALAINKELDLRFAVGYSPLEYRDALHALADGRILCDAMVTGHVGLAGVASAFSALGDADRHAKILIDPKSALSSVARF
ncbi:zinc-binding dehydrogenase [Zestomonas carbonaria]|uniref:L-threonine 3-dehydrogenase n=1 Tax=Zestomonas carbonaria TaxID=2762745 RepID=A0A7U7ESD1_9GAMM|nr:zinc-binding dehydrogenase [Pseudomonas carbonaria]CAD5109948.1 L-threonine 3-dehydrogenase [Pseudomonas carbonaria]